ncbi:M48 family metallopeptidase [Candidatus Sororendozoicomonas aggregata]|uniref:M48 family metallopeptidase n=1 Tax=Candidatus Sororendozoicomonas aggregata TaxID=3073239 RepID=UPI002ED0AA24
MKLLIRQIYHQSCSLRYGLAGIILLALMAGCQSISTTSGGELGVDRQQRMFALLSAQQVDEMADKAYRDTLKASNKKQVLNQDRVTLKRLRAIADKLIAQVGTFRTDALKWDWQVNLITDKQLNAYCMPGGKIIFYSGIIHKLTLTDDEIAAIMGHEMAHALREHGREAMSEAYAVALGKSALYVMFGVNDDALALADTVVNYSLTLPHSRTKEVEADLMGLELMARAGFNPQAAVTLWEKMSKVGGNQPPEFMSTHPNHDTRINGLAAAVHKVNALYQQAKNPQ